MRRKSIRIVSMSAELNSRPRPPIDYGNQKIRPPKGVRLEDLEALAWKFRDECCRIENSDGSGRMFKINRPLYRIQQLILKQYGLPERG